MLTPEMEKDKPTPEEENLVNRVIRELSEMDEDGNTPDEEYSALCREITNEILKRWPRTDTELEKWMERRSGRKRKWVR